MDTQTILANVLCPAALFFLLGSVSVLLHSDLELPYPLPKFFSTYLLIAIGYTGGEKLAQAGLTTEVAAAYGSISIVTFVVGMLAARKAGKLIEVGPKLVAFGILAPLANAAIGIGLTYALGMTKGNAILFTLLCASSSYIVVPAAMRQAVPEANPGLFELLSLSVTFPFNISLGIPLYYGVISRIWG